MADDTAQTPFERIAELFASHDVEFIVIGGQAEAILGSARVTYDIDLCYRRTADNFERLAAALKTLQPRLRGAPPDLRFRLDAESLALGNNFTFSTNAGDLDLLGYLEPLGGYEDIVQGAETVRIGDVAVKVISLDDLIRIKQHLGRPKDRDALQHLLAIKRVREGDAPDQRSDRMESK